MMPSAWAPSKASASFDGDTQETFQFEWTAGKKTQGLPSRYSITMKVCPFSFTDVIDDTDIGVIQGGSCLRFPAKTRQSLRACGGVVEQEFQCNEAMKARVFRLVDDTHTTAAKLFENAVMSNGVPNECLRHHLMDVWRMAICVANARSPIARTSGLL